MVRRENSFFSGKRILVTGGTGSFGRKFCEIIMAEHSPKNLLVFSRDELKQHEMRQQFPDNSDSPMRYFIGDVRDRDRLYRAFKDVDIVVHAAALKQVPACEYNPFEAVQTNIIGGKNVIDAAIDCGVKRILAISTDKAVNPVNLYGATKLCAEKLFIDAYAYAGDRDSRFACARYGNVIGSRGSVIPIFLTQKQKGLLTITDPNMTRFWITLDQGVRFVLQSIEAMQGGEIFVPKIPSMSIMDLSKALAPGCRIEFVGIRPGEKVHEVLVSEEEARCALEFEDRFIILPLQIKQELRNCSAGKSLPSGFQYTSENNTEHLALDDLMKLMESYNS